MGFSLIEVLAVLAIMGVLASIALPVAELSRKRDREAELRSALREIRTAIDAYKRAVDEGRIASPAGSSGYPPTLAALVEGVPDPRSVQRSHVYFLRRIPADPFANLSATARASGTADVAASGAATWGVRSYASPPDNPRPGADVFDVYSLSEETGLNGRPYREW